MELPSCAQPNQTWWFMSALGRARLPVTVTTNAHSELPMLRILLQSLKVSHFLRRHLGSALPPVNTGETEVCLRRQRSVLLEFQQVKPGFLRSAGVAVHRSRFAKRIESLRHLGFQFV